jgi:cell division protein FtsB
MKDAEPPPKKRSRISWLIYILLWMCLVGLFGTVAMLQAGQYGGLRDEITRLQIETERAAEAYEALQRQIAFIGSDAYIEQRARELGLVKSNQIIFRNISGN